MSRTEPIPSSDVPSDASSLDERPLRYLVVDGDPRALQSTTRELVRGGIAADDVIAISEVGAALRFLTTAREARIVAFVSWSLERPLRSDGVETPNARVLVSSLRSAGAFVVALLPRSQWQSAGDAYREGADDVLLTPSPALTLPVRALVAGEALRRVRPAPWHRPRVALREALAHPIGGEVIVSSAVHSSRIVVARGRVAWVHDDNDRGALGDRLRAHGVHVSHEELASVVAECQRTRQHLADVLARWGFAERSAVVDAMRAIVDRRLAAALTRRDAAALFVPSRIGDDPHVAFSTEELRLPGTLPPPDLEHARAPIAITPEVRGRADALALDVRALNGCLAAAVFHVASASIVSAAADADGVSLGWTLGAALDALDDPRADVFAATTARCHVVRRLASDPDCFVYAAFDLATTSLAMARLDVAAIVDRARVISPNPSDAVTGEP